MKDIDNLQFIGSHFTNYMSYIFNIPHVQLESNQPGFNLLCWCMQISLNDVQVWHVNDFIELTLLGEKLPMNFFFY